MVAYLVLQLFFAADGTAPAETLDAGVKAYKIKCDAIRKTVIAEADDRAKIAVSWVTYSKRGKIDIKLVGTIDSPGKFDKGAMWFGTAAEKEAGIAKYEQEANRWRTYSAGLKSRELCPQVQMPRSNNIVPGAVGVWHYPLRVSVMLD